MIFLKKKLLFLAVASLFFLGGCGIDGSGNGNLIYIEYNGALYCPAPEGWEVCGDGTEISAKAGYGRKSKKRKCSAVSFGDGTFLVYSHADTETLLCRCDCDLPTDADANEDSGILLRVGDEDILLDPESAGNLLGCLCPERLTEQPETVSDIGLVFAVFPSVGAMKLLGVVRSLSDGGTVLCRDGRLGYLLPDGFSVDKLR